MKLISVREAAQMLGVRDLDTFRRDLKNPDFPLSIWCELKPHAELPQHRQQRLREGDVLKYLGRVRKTYSRLVREGRRI